MVISACEDFSRPLQAEMLFDWHRMLLKTQRFVKIGAWRTHEEPMQVVSGAIGREVCIMKLRRQKTFLIS